MAAVIDAGVSLADIVQEIKEHPDAGVKLATLLGTAMLRRLTGVEVGEALKLISDIRRGE